MLLAQRNGPEPQTQTFKTLNSGMLCGSYPQDTARFLPLGHLRFSRRRTRGRSNTAGTSTTSTTATTATTATTTTTAIITITTTTTAGGRA